MSLEQQIRRLADRTDILETLYTYTRYADRLDPDAMVTLFTEDCIVSYIQGQPMHGRRALHEMLSTYLPNSTSSIHYLSNTQVLFEGDDAAIVHTYMYSWQRFKTYPVTADCHRYGRYEIRIIRTAEGWRFTDMRLLSHGEYGGSRICEQLDRPWPPIFERAG
jgi:uncharacterized protein (TIGR02246 family)